MKVIGIWFFDVQLIGGWCSTRELRDGVDRLKGNIGFLHFLLYLMLFAGEGVHIVTVKTT